MEQQERTSMLIKAQDLRVGLGFEAIEDLVWNNPRLTKAQEDLRTRVYFEGLKDEDPVNIIKGYTYLVAKLYSQMYKSGKLNPKTRIYRLMEAGFVPVFLAPTFFIDNGVARAVKEYCFDNKIQTQDTRPYDLSGRPIVNAISQDTWVSRIDFGELLGLPLNSIRTGIVIQEVYGDD